MGGFFIGRIANLGSMTEMIRYPWLYDGAPENIGLIIPDADPAEGGYVMLAELRNGDVRMFATRFPGRCVSGWKSQIDKFGGQRFQRVLVTVPHIRYERIKRLVAEQIGEEQEGCIELFKKRTTELFEQKLIGRDPETGNYRLIEGAVL